MIFNTVDNRTKFDRLKRSTSSISVPFNAGRRTGFKVAGNAADIKMEDWITAKLASEDISIRNLVANTANEFEIELVHAISDEDNNYAQLLLDHDPEAQAPSAQFYCNYTGPGESAEARVYAEATEDRSEVNLSISSTTGGSASLTLLSAADTDAAVLLNGIVIIEAIDQYADNNEAQLDGLPVGALYHTAGVLKIVLP